METLEACNFGQMVQTPPASTTRRVQQVTSHLRALRRACLFEH